MPTFYPPSPVESAGFFLRQRVESGHAIQLSQRALGNGLPRGGHGDQYGSAFVTRPLPFSPDAWQTNRRQRPRMVQDLLAAHPFVGISRAEVELLLGTPDPGSDDERLFYWAGRNGIDDMWLEIRLRGEMVVDARHYPD